MTVVRSDLMVEGGPVVLSKDRPEGRDKNPES